MATSSRQSALFGIQDWKRIYQTYREADFQSYDYETLRKSFIDYLTTYYPETFNDYVESSEYVALLDVIAFMGQALSFRNDLNTRENFIDTAERRDSVIKLANLVGYTPKRNIAGQGLLKITSISTTESVVDINGLNLSNTIIIWNDSANPIWQEQFNAIINAALINNQRIGRPGNSKIIQDIKTDEYSINIPPNQLSIVPFKTEIDGQLMNFELVSVSSVNSEVLEELPPAPNGQMNIVYRNDKLGFGSVNTGFFIYFKEGSLQSYDFSFAESIENNFQNINIPGINNSDTWLYQLTDDNTEGAIWKKVDSVYKNVTQEAAAQRNKFSVVSRSNDQVRYVFGDGVFSEIPVGNFRTYIRSGNGLTYSINPSEMQGVNVSISYISRTNRIETLNLTLTLNYVVSTAQQRESISQIKERAPTRYYTQNRMVNAEDYSNFPFTLYNSIIKSKAINRSSIGVNRNQDLADPTGKYSSTNIFADDGVLWKDEVPYTTIFSADNINIASEFISINLSALISSTKCIQYYQDNYPTYTGSYPGPIDNSIYWEMVTLENNDYTGYFYVKTQVVPTLETAPIPVGNFSGESPKLISAGTQLKFIPPVGYYFDINRQLRMGTPTPALGDTTELWTEVTTVVGDGYNYGRGNLSNGLGPIRISNYIPTGARLDPTEIPSTGSPAYGNAIIPSLDNTLRASLQTEILTKIQLKQSFTLDYDNSIVNPEDRWYTKLLSAPQWLIKFEYMSIDGTYLVTVKNTQYYFGSVSQVRFLFEEFKKIYDSKSGQTIMDYVSVLKSNPTSTLTGVLGLDYILTITGQSILSDGYANDYSVEVSSLTDSSASVYSPKFFDTLVPASGLVFFKITNSSTSLYQTVIVPAGTIITAFNTESQILDSVYEYPDNTIFYAITEQKFFRSIRNNTVDQVIYILDDVTAEYIVKSGRYSINFQYRHNSSNTSRVDPGTTNIIDLYVVTQNYYNDYQNWLNDPTNTVLEPARPTITELQEIYSDLNEYKMLSDTIVINSVVFKPLFGQKAVPALRGTIKIIKSVETTISDSQIRSLTLAALNEYFTLDKWDFGNTFYFSELSAFLHAKLAGLISSVVLVPNDPNQTFGDLYEINCAPNEIFVNGATTTDIVVISALTPAALQKM